MRAGAQDVDVVSAGGGGYRHEPLRIGLEGASVEAHPDALNPWDGMDEQGGACPRR